jgi:hypothetical protein
MSYNIQRGLIILIAALGTEVHEQVDGVGHSRGVLGGLEDGLVFGMFLAARFLGRHLSALYLAFCLISVAAASSARKAVRKVLREILCSEGRARRLSGGAAALQR